MKEWQMAFLAKCWNLFSLSDSTRRVHEQIKEVNQPSFFENEKQKVNEIRSLIDNGKHDEALHAVLQDFAHEDGIRYFNRIRYLESDDKVELNHTTDVKLRKVNCHNTECFCCWEGFHSSHKLLHCTNRKMLHPWKKTTNACNVEEPVISNYCAYHQNFCSDEFQRHQHKSARIFIANKFALCAECYILKEGRQPEQLSRIPGVKRKTITQTKSNEEQNSNTPTYIIFNEPITLSKNNSKREDERNEDYFKKATAAKKIQSRWRSRSRQIEREMHDYEQHLHLNNAALKVQEWFRGLPKGKAQMKSVLNLKSYDNSHLPTGRTTMLKSCLKQHRSIIHQFNHDHLRMYLLNQPKYIRNTIQRDVGQGRIGKVRVERSSPTRKCKLPSCQLCNNRSIDPVKRQRIDLVAPFHDKSSVFSRKKVLTDDICFKAEDPFEIGIISKSRFEALLTKSWKRIGHPLPNEELESIVNTFSCRNGYINYESFLNFATEQNIPCSIHGRFLCTSSKCVHRSCGKGKPCKRFSPSSPNSLLCKCGKYISRHHVNPKAKAVPTTKRGLDIFSIDDMKRTFARQTMPDVKNSINFRPVDSVMKNRNNIKLYQYRDLINEGDCKEYDKTSDQYPAICSLCSTSTKQKHNTQLPTQLASEIIPTQQEEAGPNLYKSFSPDNLAEMLKDCIKYRIPSVQKKPTVSCPLCQRTFFNDSALKNHIIQRHTKQEIQNYLEIEEERKNGNDNIKILWIGRYISCPPFKCTFPLDLCYNHLTPHPKCLKCIETIRSLPMFPPIRFYTSAYFQYNLPSSFLDDKALSSESSTSMNKTATKRQFHFNLKDEEYCVVLESGSYAKIEALCEDNFKRCFIGVLHFVTYDTFKDVIAVTKGCSFSRYCKSNNIELNRSDELILTSTVEWIEMTKVIGRLHVFFCDEDEFIQKKLNMRLSIDNDLDPSSTSTLKFCQLKWMDDELQSLLK